jgi:hypothetical protein
MVCTNSRLWLESNWVMQVDQRVLHLAASSHDPEVHSIPISLIKHLFASHSPLRGSVLLKGRDGSVRSISPATARSAGRQHASAKQRSRFTFVTSSSVKVWPTRCTTSSHRATAAAPAADHMLAPHNRSKQCVHTAAMTSTHAPSPM